MFKKIKKIFIALASIIVCSGMSVDSSLASSVVEDKEEVTTEVYELLELEKVKKFYEVFSETFFECSNQFLDHDTFIERAKKLTEELTELNEEFTELDEKDFLDSGVFKFIVKVDDTLTVEISDTHVQKQVLLPLMFCLEAASPHANHSPAKKFLARFFKLEKILKDISEKPLDFEDPLPY